MTDQMWEQRERAMNEGWYQQGQKAAEQGNLMVNFLWPMSSGP